MNRRMTFLFGGSIALLLFALMALLITNTQPWNGEASNANVDQANEQATLVDTLFGPQVVTFEVLGILLTAAMIGALVIARPIENPAEDKDNYTHPTPAQVAESDRTSDVAAHSTRQAAEGANK